MASPMLRLILVASAASSAAALRVSFVIAGVSPRAACIAPSSSTLLRAPPCRLAVDDGDGESDDIMAELRKALSDVGESERKASDERVIDGFVEDRKGEISAPLEELNRSLDSVADSIDEKMKDELASVESDMLGKIDAAVEALRRGNEGSTFDPKIAEPGAQPIEADLSAALPDGALIVVAGAGTRLGRSLVRGLSGAGRSWRVRALVAQGSKLDMPAGVDCESVALAPFAPTALANSLSGASAVIIVTAAAGGNGGVEPEVVPKLLKGLPSSGVRRLVMLSVHGVERADKLPFSMQNMFGQVSAPPTCGRPRGCSHTQPGLCRRPLSHTAASHSGLSQRPLTAASPLAPLSYLAAR